uniref:NTR domain-containing protein n=1 Tax=Acrobeloides nanus TaxID=290746 RepID=A0A914E6T9_9BILA
MLSSKEFIYACSCIIFASIEIVNACSCSENPLNKTYCDADWIAKIRVDKIKLMTNLDTNEKVYYIYEVKILEQFK